MIGPSPIARLSDIIEAIERLWNVARDDLPPLEKASREELAAEIAHERGDTPGNG